MDARWDTRADAGSSAVDVEEHQTLRAYARLRWLADTVVEAVRRADATARLEAALRHVP
jgi:hypothetical protein